MDKKIIEKLKSVFDEVAHISDDGIEFWSASELVEFSYTPSSTNLFLSLKKRYQPAN